MFARLWSSIRVGCACICQCFFTSRYVAPAFGFQKNFPYLNGAPGSNDELKGMISEAYAVCEKCAKASPAPAAVVVDDDDCQRLFPPLEADSIVSTLADSRFQSASTPAPASRQKTTKLVASARTATSKLRHQVCNHIPAALFSPQLHVWELCATVELVQSDSRCAADLVMQFGFGQGATRMKWALLYMHHPTPPTRHCGKTGEIRSSRCC